MEKLRAQLQTVNQHILQLFSERRHLLAAIMAHKQECGEQGYSPEQERRVFMRLKPLLVAMDLGELASFSLLMEAQAHQKDAHYPRWSQGVHLLTPSPLLVGQINPLLLMVVAGDLLESLPPLREDFAKVFSEG